MDKLCASAVLVVGGHRSGHYVGVELVKEKRASRRRTKVDLDIRYVECDVTAMEQFLLA